jgi:hypothetical protein
MNLRIVDNKIAGLPENYLVLLLVKMTLRDTPCFGAVICPVSGYPPLGTRSTEIFEAKAAVFGENGLPVAISHAVLGSGQKYSAGGGSITFQIERTQNVVQWTTRGTCEFLGITIKPEDILIAH